MCLNLNLMKSGIQFYFLSIILKIIIFILVIQMKFSISYPTNGTTKSFDIDDDNRCRVFFEKRMGQEVQADTLGQQFKGYVFRINGGFDKDGFAMKQGVFCNNRIRLLLSPGAQGYRVKRKGERKRRSVRGCIVGPDIKLLSLTLIKKGDKDIPGLTDETRNRRLGPKRATGIRKLYGIEKVADEKTSQSSCALIKKHAIRRTFKSKKNAEANRHKAPKIQRLVTESRLRRKRIHKEDKVRRWKRTIQLASEYEKVYDSYATKKRAEHKERKAERLAVVHKKSADIAPAKTVPVKVAPVKAAPAKVATTTKAPAPVKAVTKAPAPVTKVADKPKVAKKV